MRVVALLALAAAASAAVPGSSESPFPGREDWLSTTNDGVITFRNHDDGMTASVEAGGITPNGVRSAFSFRLDTCLPAGLRCDELRLAAGSSIHPDDSRYTGEVLIGGEVVGNLDGQSLQNNAHALMHNRPTFAQYDQSFRPSPYAVASIYPAKGPGVDASVEADVWTLRWDTRVRYEDRSGHFRATAGWRMHWGHPPSATADSVLCASDGWILSLAIRAGHLGYAFELGQHSCLASLGLAF